MVGCKLDPAERVDQLAAIRPRYAEPVAGHVTPWSDPEHARDLPASDRVSKAAGSGRPRD